MTQISGSCLCGAVTFAGDVEIAFAANCHCTDCRRATGAAYATLVFASTDGLSIEGKTASFRHSSDRGSQLDKVFCPSCGSPLFSVNAAREGLIGIRIGVLDQAQAFAPERNIFCASALASTPMDTTLPKFSRMPT